MSEVQHILKETETREGESRRRFETLVENHNKDELDLKKRITLHCNAFALNFRLRTLRKGNMIKFSLILLFFQQKPNSGRNESKERHKDQQR